MYKCGICGVKFDEPVQIHDNGWEGLPWYATEKVCPVCGADERHFEKIENEEDET